MVHGSWFDRLDKYLSEFQLIIGRLQDVLEQARLQTRDLSSSHLQPSQEVLQECLKALERKVAERAKLLTATDAPSEGTTLTEKVLHSGDGAPPHLAARCRDLSSEISTLNQRAVALFVCQYHLAHLGGEIVRVLSGHAGPVTYRAPGRPEAKPPSGGLFNEAA